MIVGATKRLEVEITVNLDCKPKFYEERPVPYALKEKKMVASVAVVLKDDSSAKICREYKQTINQASLCDKYPVAKIEDLFATLQGREQFSKLDLTHPYQQLALTQEPHLLLTVNIYKVLFQLKRLQFGVHSASRIFQTVGRDDAEHFHQCLTI